MIYAAIWVFIIIKQSKAVLNTFQQTQAQSQILLLFRWQIVLVYGLTDKQIEQILTTNKLIM